MRVIVSKFGGSSTANADQFRRILEILRASPARRCVVLSAPGVDDRHREKVTSMLEKCWNDRGDGTRLRQSADQVALRFAQIACALALPDPGEMARREVLGAVNISLAHTLSRGEYLCARLFSRYSGIPMVDAGKVIAFDSAGDPDHEATRRNFEAVSGSGRFILPGFYGADPSGDIRVFPRNGSDITGALAAACLDAALYENWTDVPGLMTADPRLVPQARLIPQVSYRQMRALARAGAQVLHPACLDPVAMAGIPTRLRSTMDPASFGTLIDDRCQQTAPAIAGRIDGDGAVISVFGLPPKRVLNAAEVLKPLDAQVHSDRVSLRVPRGELAEATRRLHRTLVGSCRESIPHGNC